MIQRKLIEWSEKERTGFPTNFRIYRGIKKNPMQVFLGTYYIRS